MTAKHTPGPWGLQVLTLNHHGYDWPIYAARSGGSNIGGHCLAIIGDVDRATAEQNTANARLIAAAPELLDCVKLAKHLSELAINYYINDMGEDENSPNIRGHKANIAIYDAAIAKAEGRAQ